MPGYESRFGGIARLYGREGQERLRAAHVGIVGVGGVGSWAAEALARSGVGEITLVDLDEVCISNTNRQVHALQGEQGQPKVEVMAARLRRINPELRVHPAVALFTSGTADTLLGAPLTFLVDAIDSLAEKCLLIARCRERGLPLVTAGGAGGRRDPTAIRVADLACSTHDALLQQVRRRLRKEFGFCGAGARFGVDSVYSIEPPVFPQPGGGVGCEPPVAGDLRLDCHSGYGTASFVTGAFGFAAASVAVRRIAMG